MEPGSQYLWVWCKSGSCTKAVDEVRDKQLALICP